MNKGITHCFAALLTAALTAITLSACGGGSSSSSPTATPASTVAITDAPSSSYSHVWITVNSVWFHKFTGSSSDTDPATSDDSDKSWVQFPLASPATYDLVSLTNGNLANAFPGLDLPAGTYGQVRLFLADPDAALAASATQAGLAYNDEVDTTDSTGAVTRTKLEVVTPADGLAVTGHFTVSDSQPLSLALDFDINHDVVEFASGDTYSYILSPTLHYWNLANVGAITGKVDPSALYNANTNPNGAYDLVISAQTLDNTGTVHAVARYTTVRSDGSFTLFPVSAPSNTQNYDVVITGRNMLTTVIQSVPVNAGTGPESGQNPTVIQTDPIMLTAGSDETSFFANLDSGAPLSPTNGYVGFYQTLGATAPYLIRLHHTVPFSGTFLNSQPLSTGLLMTGVYSNGTDIVLNSAAPVGGAGFYNILAAAPGYAESTLGASSVIAATPGDTQTFTVPALAVAAPAVADSIGGTLKQTSSGYNAGFLAVTKGGYIVTALDASAVLAQNGGTGGSFTIGNIPGGSSSASDPTAVYRLYGRFWNTSNPAATVSLRSLGAFVSLANGSASNVTLTLP